MVGVIIWSTNKRGSAHYWLCEDQAYGVYVMLYFICFCDLFYHLVTSSLFRVGIFPEVWCRWRRHVCRINKWGAGDLVLFCMWTGISSKDRWEEMDKRGFAAHGSDGCAPLLYSKYGFHLLKRLMELSVGKGSLKSMYEFYLSLKFLIFLFSFSLHKVTDLWVISRCMCHRSFPSFCLLLSLHVILLLSLLSKKVMGHWPKRIMVEV